MKIKEELAKLKDIDVYSLMLFAMFKLRDIPEYAYLTDMVYILDKDRLFRLCEYVGGLTIKIPTIEELESIIYSLVLYQFVNIDGMDYDDAVKIIGHKSSQLRQVKSDYVKICDILDRYDFSRGES